MIRFFISHAAADTPMAERLYSDLRNSGHEVFVDTQTLKLGDDAIDFMNKALEEADVLIILYSQNSEEAAWQQKEVNAALWSEVAQSGGKIVVFRLDDSKLPPLLGSKVYGKLTDASYDEYLAKLCSEFVPKTTATSLVSEALAVGSPNPFWRVRAEYFEEDWPKLLADAFSPPGAAKIGILEEMMPCFLEGSRGTGKTMLLLSLRARILATRKKSRKAIEELFGFYLRLDRGAFCNVGVADDTAELHAQMGETFSQEFYLLLLESLFSELSFCARQPDLIGLSAGEESRLVREVSARLWGSQATAPPDLVSLLATFADLHRQIADFVRRRFIYRESCSIPVAILDLEMFKRILEAVRLYVPALAKSQFTILLDEYENLLAYQKTIVNTAVKLGPPHFSVKIARKVGTDEVSQTLIGQDLQETHDYNLIPLVYTVDNDLEARRFSELLDSIVANLFKSQGLRYDGLASMLPEDPAPEVEDDKLVTEIAQLCRISRADFDALPEALQREKRTYYGEAAIYRVLHSKRGSRAEKRFTGVRQLVFVSSGVIRYFQEIMGMAFHLEFGNERPSGELVISPKSQTRAVHIVSNHNLSSLSRNVAKYGEVLKYLLLDLGDSLRHKLLRHRSEPEAGRIAVVNPELLPTPRFQELGEVLRVGVREGVFQTLDGRPGMRPKHSTEPQPVEFTLLVSMLLHFSLARDCAGRLTSAAPIFGG